MTALENEEGMIWCMRRIIVRPLCTSLICYMPGLPSILFLLYSNKLI